jgi:hypothetical protein
MKRTALRRKKPINPVSKRRRKRDKDYQLMRAEVWMRARGRCEAPVHADDCTFECQEVHHLAGRVGPDPHNPDNLIGLSSACHRYVHAHPEWAYHYGLMRKRVA